MAQLDTLDIVVLVVLLVGSVAYFTKGSYWAVPKDPYAAANSAMNGAAKTGKTRDIIQKMEETGKNCVIFYGSQTGTAEDYASRLAKEGSQRFGLKTMVADLEDYDYENLDKFPEDKIAFFVLATYGEGEPTDNAVEFYQFITGEDVAFESGASAEEKPLSSLKYVAFGLGNNTYEHYNAMVRHVDAALTKLGAQRIGTAGEGDDGAGTMEEDFLAWKEPMWAALSESMNLQEREAVYEPVFSVIEDESLSPEDDSVYLGEPTQGHLSGSPKGPYSAHNPYIAPIVESRELFTAKDRNCLHMEIGIAGSNLTYQTGDHIAIWPTNAGVEVDRFLEALALKRSAIQLLTSKVLMSLPRFPFRPQPHTTRPFASTWKFAHLFRVSSCPLWCHSPPTKKAKPRSCALVMIRITFTRRSATNASTSLRLFRISPRSRSLLSRFRSLSKASTGFSLVTTPSRLPPLFKRIRLVSQLSLNLSACLVRPISSRA